MLSQVRSGGVTVLGTRLSQCQLNNLWDDKLPMCHFGIHRDLQDIGCYINVIEGCQQLDKETR